MKDQAPISGFCFQSQMVDGVRPGSCLCTTSVDFSFLIVSQSVLQPLRQYLNFIAYPESFVLISAGHKLESPK